MTDKEYNEKLDRFAEIAFSSLMQSDSTNGWGFDAIARQAYLGAAAMMCYREDYAKE